jgi:hypothetical protein
MTTEEEPPWGTQRQVDPSELPSVKGQSAPPDEQAHVSERRELCGHRCLKEADHDPPHFYGYALGPVVDLDSAESRGVRAYIEGDDDLRRKFGGAFYEDDEPVEQVKAAFDNGDKSVIAAPVDGERMYTASEIAYYQTSEAEIVSRPLRRRLDRAEADLAVAKKQLDQVRKWTERPVPRLSDLFDILDAAPAGEAVDE